jgi:hypothetical protein
MAKQDMELPLMATTYYTSNTSPIGDLSAKMAAIHHSTRRIGNTPNWQEIFASKFGEQEKPTPAELKSKQQPKETKVAESARRIVQIFIADTDPNVPLDHALLYSGKEQFTDLTDQELFFELDMATILKKHNEYRVTLHDKSIKSKTVNLEPARIRDLKMTVVVIATF